ncbi:uroporphyrinogen-III C-methyltransferase [Teredinibacter turnerae]|uniref:uroporphyrinogen-III C-methyltransferase n=1 Tax=Teredinibacter turnerae TaxID=2426 RepID=UPI0004073CFF|nr:uroporphyrinogen-III C-methyltransferase [Teredinibacter turnerae]
MTDDKMPSPQEESQSKPESDQPSEQTAIIVVPAPDGSDSTADKAAEQTPDPEAEQGPPSEPPTEPRKGSGIPWFSLLLLLLILLVAGAVAGLGWYGYGYYQQTQSKAGELAELQQQLAAQSQQLNQLRQALSTVGREREQAVGTIGDRLTAAEQRLQAQNKRLLAMSTITREDWLLAEAEYLLKLANQRILIERSAEGADALLTEADAILRDLDDPDLFALRKAVNNDLAALRLINKIDREGLYLQINGLITQVVMLPVRPDREQVLGRGKNPEGETLDENLTTDNWWAAMKKSLRAFGKSLSHYININNHAEKPAPLMSAESAQYLQQNVRLMLERAQLALLREQQSIYTNSLEQAEGYLAQFYPASAPVERYRQELSALAERDIVVELPDISGSLELLHSYIEDLHNLKGAGKPSAGGN